MQITETEIWADTVKVVIEGHDLTLGDTAPKITIRMPIAGDEKASLAFHRLATLQQARDVIGDQILRLKRIVDQSS